VPGPGGEVGGAALASPDLAGVHFTGSTEVFRGIWAQVGAGVGSGRYRTYPRLVGETGGKDFVMAHRSADPAEAAVALVRGAFEYQGQKCSAASRAYLPDSLWPEIRERLVAELAALRMGPPDDFGSFMNAVIDRPAFERIRDWLERIRSAPDARIVSGGDCDDSSGYYISPAVVEVDRPDFPSMVEEIFGPVLSVWVYPAEEYAEALALCDRTGPYGLTGSVFARERAALALAERELRGAAGNFYINDKPTGAVVGQQPFGGARVSGTNDKAGSFLNLVRWVSARSIKETFVPPTDYRYPFLE
jgi:1-pyrroline-5-carboxylate dehydrogenase